ncbi:MAG: TolC family protein [Prevotellaceae bacterium]|nr:TolC family protein [Prevotellaceae bacterium]
MKNRLFLTGCLFLLCQAALPQVTIEACYRKVRENYPLIKQYDLIAKAKAYNLENAAKGYLPQLSFSAKATYQSDVTKIPIDLAQLGFEGVKIPHLSKDQYGLTLDVSQTLWDGGEIRSERKSIESASEVEQRSVEVSVYAVNAQVNQLFFGILLADAQIERNRLLKQDLQHTYEQVSASVAGGVANQSDLDAVQVDRLKAEQNEVEYVSTRKAYISMLAQLTGMELDDNTQFVKPDDLSRPTSDGIYRPELWLYDARIHNYEMEERRITAGLLPKLGLFVTGGYGKPGLDLFENDFAPYYTAGVRLSWNIGNFYTLKNRRNSMRNNILQVETERDTFLFNTRLDIIEKDETINKYAGQLKYDDEIVRLKASVCRASEAKMLCGTISGTDLTRDIDAEQVAIQERILHEMRLLLAIYDLKFATNN